MRFQTVIIVSLIVAIYGDSKTKQDGGKKNKRGILLGSPHLLQPAVAPLPGFPWPVAAAPPIVHHHHAAPWVPLAPTVTKVAVPVPVPVDRHIPVAVPVDRPVPVHVPVIKHVAVPVIKHIPVDRPVPVPVDRPVPVPVHHAVPVDRPYPVPVPQPYPVFVNRAVPATPVLPGPILPNVAPTPSFLGQIPRPFPVQTSQPLPTASSALQAQPDFANLRAQPDFSNSRPFHQNSAHFDNTQLGLQNYFSQNGEFDNLAYRQEYQRGQEAAAQLHQLHESNSYLREKEEHDQHLGTASYYRKGSPAKLIDVRHKTVVHPSRITVRTNGW